MSDAHSHTPQNELSLRDFSYELPESLIAQQPLPQRDSARCLIWNRDQISHSQVKRLPEHIPDGALLIVNDSRVIASRIRFELPTGASGEFLLLEPVDGDQAEVWHCLARPVKKLKESMTLNLGHGLCVTILERPSPSSQGPEPLKVQFSLAGAQFRTWLSTHAEMPLPPYIERRSASKSQHDADRIRYQTVYAKPEGSVAAPTAGLHFTDGILDLLKSKGCHFASTTLHVGAGTFLPVKADRISDHKMHAERFLVPRETLEEIKSAKAERRPVVVVGTTALRSLEGLKQLADQKSLPLDSLVDKWHRTSIFIRPKHKEDRYQPWAADALMTNFHQPESTLIMLISALVGYDNTRRIYAEAIAEGYRFFSYGDSSLLWLSH